MVGTTTEQIKEKLDIVQFLREYLTLIPAGRNFKALCPFHKEKTPSFSVSPERQTWHCFGCGAHGDVFGFLMQREGIEFGDALRILAEKAGVELRRLNPAEYKFAGLLNEINAAAKLFFMDQLKRSPVAEKYLAERGLTKETIEEFEVGFAPNAPEALTLHLLKLRYSSEDVIRSGLAFKTERGMQIDRFRGRIMFPIHDHFGKAVGFSGRILPQFDTGEMGKYINSPETPVFVKSRILYGFHRTKNYIREAGWAFLVEGQVDLLMSYQAGVKNVAASSGTALTPDHLRALRRLTDQLVVSFDSDEAGIEAAERAVDLAEAADFGVKIVRFGTYKDPAEAVQANPGELQKAIAAAVPAPEFYFEKYLPAGRIDRRDRGYLRSIRAILTKLRNIASAVDRSFWLKELAKRTKVDERVLAEEAERIAEKPQIQTAAAEGPEPVKRPLSRWELLSEQLISACLAKSDFSFMNEHERYLAAEYVPVYKLVVRGERRSADGKLDELLNIAILRSEELDDAEITKLKDYLFEEYVRFRRRELTENISAAEAEGNGPALTVAMQELSGLPAL